MISQLSETLWWHTAHAIQHNGAQGFRISSGCCRYMLQCADDDLAWMVSVGSLTCFSKRILVPAPSSNHAKCRRTQPQYDTGFALWNDLGDERVFSKLLWHSTGFLTRQGRTCRVLRWLWALHKSDRCAAMLGGHSLHVVEGLTVRLQRVHVEVLESFRSAVISSVVSSSVSLQVAEEGGFGERLLPTPPFLWIIMPLALLLKLSTGRVPLSSSGRRRWCPCWRTARR